MKKTGNNHSVSPCKSNINWTQKVIRSCKKTKETKQPNIIITTADQRVPQSYGMTITLQKMYTQSQHKPNITTSAKNNNNSNHYKLLPLTLTELTIYKRMETSLLLVLCPVCVMCSRLMFPYLFCFLSSSSVIMS